MNGAAEIKLLAVVKRAFLAGSAALGCERS
jgi:hypothetical protein